MLHISIKAEPIFRIFGFNITNSLLSSVTVLIIFILLSYLFASSMSKKKTKITLLILFILESMYSLFSSILKEKTRIFYPLLMTFFLFVLLSNWFGLIPGVGSITIREPVVAAEHVAENPVYVPLLRGSTADLNTTIAIALISVILIQYYGIKFVGLKGYLSKFVNFANPIGFFVGILELISEFSKIISFAFRLFGNIFAGEVLLVVIAFLIPILASFPFLLLEIFVGFIQALVFSMLTAIFINVAIIKHH